MQDITRGQLLIADPFLGDTNFQRSVVFLCEHNKEGSMGFILNRNSGRTIGELFSGMEGQAFPVYIGGPVQQDRLFFIHTEPDMIPGGIKILKEVYWGGDAAITFAHIKNGLLNEQQLKLFIGYSGWETGQLAYEMDIKSWLTTDATRELLFLTDAKEIWNQSILSKGGDFTQLIHYPTDPLLN